MLALITGASGGIGRDMAIMLSKKGYDLILVARSEDKLNTLKKSLKTKVDVIALDLSKPENCFKLYEQTKARELDVLINNAGFGLFGNFTDTKLSDELEMIDLNIKCVHILTKLYLKDFVKRDKGHIMNVASLASFCVGPLMGTYYATKSYVLKLTLAIKEELRHMHSNVHICALCPGPIDTGFNNRAGVTFSVKPLTSYHVASYALTQMFRGKLIILPSPSNKFLATISKISPISITLKVCYYMQKSKQN